MSSQTVTLTIQVPKAELTVLRETLRLSRERQKDPAKFIVKTALDDAISHASSTVDVRHWKRLQAFARKLGTESPI